MEEGFEGLRATPDDWQTHLNTLFPEVRLKRTVEVRGADSQSTGLTCALPALTKGLFYDETALSAAEALVSGLDHATVAAARPMIARDGLRAELAGREVGEWADSLLSIARSGLQRIAALDEEGRDESVHLEPLSQLLERGQTPAEALLEQIDLEQPLAPQLLRHARL